MNNEIIINGKLSKYLKAPIVLTILPAVMDVLMYMKDIKIGMMGTVIAVVYLVIICVLYQHNKSIIFDELVEFATGYGQIQNLLLDNFEVPYALLDADGRIMWMNQSFSKATDKEKKYHKSISTIFPGITKEVLAKSDEHDVDVTLNRYDENDPDKVTGSRTYRVHTKKILFEDIQTDGNNIALRKEKDDCLICLYMFDETKLKRYMKENYDMQMVIALVYIDNYEEVMETVEDVKRALLIAMVDRRVTKYFSSSDAIVKKTERDKYIVLFKRQYLEKIIEGNFSILQDIKSVKASNELSVTLSIGIGSACKTFNQNYEYARASVELALARGGDQAVHKSKEKTTYYGSGNQQIDKNTRVKARVKAQALREIMVSRDNIFVMGHKLADVDAFGAAIGIYCAGRHVGKKVQIVLNDVTASLRPVKELFTPENGYPEDLFIRGEEALELFNPKTHAVVVVDTNRTSYTECPELISKAKTVVVFDHHRKGTETVKNAVLSYIEPYASSTCEMIAEVLQYYDEGIKLSSREADTIYAGVLVDTNNFMTKTGVRTFEAAAYLRRCGAEVTRVRKLMRNDMNAYKARAEAIRRAEVFMGCFAISVCPAELVESPTIACAQAANELLNIIGIKASFVLTKFNDKIYISSRSIDEINVHRIMEKLGGGGHLNTAGAQLKDCTIEDAISTIKETIEQLELTNKQ